MLWLDCAVCSSVRASVCLSGISWWCRGINGLLWIFLFCVRFSDFSCSYIFDCFLSCFLYKSIWSVHWLCSVCTAGGVWRRHWEHLRWTRRRCLATCIIVFWVTMLTTLSLSVSCRSASVLPACQSSTTLRYQQCDSAGFWPGLVAVVFL